MSERAMSELSADVENLYREEIFTDLRAATIRRLSPVLPDGSPDPERGEVFVGETTLVSQVGPIPVQCPIDARTLAEALEKFPEAVRDAIDRLNERAQEMRREEASRIVVPTGMPPDLAGGGRGGMPGKIILDK